MKQRRRPNGSRVSRNGSGNGDPRKAYEKYVAMAQAAEVSGDLVSRERYFQHADHYYRIMKARAQKPDGQPGSAPENG